ncbi:trace amine-associated receptor 13c-like [Denticeps clupeoides]|uniref:trace amine-associated receptor 13c-like n=1 Tax=Denticeps clupeoides TaxID=299321 RepID=UPI0010A2A9E0|nr:trace amine-associated receptor 13c-like [Denticeps clupeoides]XP_028858234.1 trace amine-associated receptor 13c-like [Denticeps clupeoides]
MSTEIYVLLYTLTAAAVLLTACGNLLVIVSVCLFRQLHTPTNLLILSLAVTDFLVGILVMPFHMTRLIELCWIFGSAICEVYKLSGLHLTFVSVYNIALIAVDRYLGLSHPFQYRCLVSLNVILAAVLSIWLVSFFYNSSVLYVTNSSIRMCPGQCYYGFVQTIFISDLLITFILPCGTITVLYTRIFVTARRHAVAIRALCTQRDVTIASDKTSTMKSERKAAKILGIVVAVFLACLMPYFLSTVMFDLMEAQSASNIFNSLDVLFSLNSTINPIIYALFYPWFKKSIKLILTFRIFRTDPSFIIS